MISNELLEEIIDVSNKRKFISKGLLLRIAVNIIEQTNFITKSKFQEIRFVDMDWDFAGAVCDKINGVIKIDYEKIINYEKSLCSSYLNANLEIIQIVLHEIEHLDEFFKSKQNNFQSKLINISSSEFISNMYYDKSKTLYRNQEKRINYTNKKFREFNEKNYEIIPIERIADIDSYKKLLNSLDNFPNFYNMYLKTYAFILKQYLNSLKSGYIYDEEKDKYNVPLLDYLKVINYKDSLENLDIYLKKSNEVSNKMSIEQRMKYGLSIKNQDIKEINKQKILIRGTK